MKSKVRIEKIRIGGVEYSLTMDMYALEMIEEKWGGMRQAQEAMKNGKTFTTLREIFVILCNAAKEAQDLPEDTPEDAIRHATIEEIAELTQLVQDLILYGKRTETAAGQEASDERTELYQDEEDEKNG